MLKVLALREHQKAQLGSFHTDVVLVMAAAPGVGMA